MNAPWVMDARQSQRIDDLEMAELSNEKLAEEIASDPEMLADAICGSSNILMLTRALASIYASGQQATPAQSLALCLAVQAIADEAAPES